MNNKKGRVIALGHFDGVHLGHTALLKQAVSLAQERGLLASAFVFDSDPDNVFAGACVTPFITDNTTKAQLMAQLGLEEVIYVPFNPNMARLTPSEFVDMLKKEYDAKILVCGFHYHFGIAASGNAELLKKLCEKREMECCVVEAVSHDGMLISATKIRSLITSGNMELAMALLGRPFTVQGEVYHGKKVGSRLGYPTINQTLDPYSIVPMYGVYATKVLVDGVWHQAVTNVGVRPTVEKTHAYNMETFILDLDADLYGKSVSVAFYKLLRPETKFNSIDELRAAIAENVCQTKEYFSLYK